jgi:hypothetical protein
MAELTIAQLTELLAANVDNADLLPIWDNTASETKKITISNFRTAVGVSNWSESFSSTTQATSQWIPNNAATNVNAAITPKGTGAIVAAIPDGTAVGGNARGQYAVDFQMVRSAANQVASGDRSFIGSGINNRNENTNSVIVGGINNLISGSGSGNHLIAGGNGNSINSGQQPHFIGGGTSNSLTFGSYSVVVGGQSNTAAQSHVFMGGGQSNSGGSAGSHTVVVGGQSNTTNASYATIVGGQTNTATGTWSFIGGGQLNASAGYYNVIGGGFTNSGTANAAVTTQSTTTTSGTTAATLSGANASIKVGQYITGTGIASDTYVAAISGTSLTLSKNATASATNTLSFFTPHGVVVGGGNNQATGSYSFIGGGGDAGNTANRNIVSGDWSVIVGGRTNSVTGSVSAALSGSSNSVAGGLSVIAGGSGNSISQGSQSYQFIGGGASNQVLNGFGVVCGGNANRAGSGGGFTHGQSFVGGGDSNIAATDYGTIGGGQSNSVTGTRGIIAGGRSNTASNSYTHIGGGQSNTASATHTTVGGGQSNTASAAHSFVGGGQTNTASGSYSMVIGGLSANSNLYGQSSHASGQFSAQGDAQAHELIWRREITGTATTELFLDGASVAAILPSTNSVWHGIIDIASICTVAGAGTTVVGDVAATSYKATIKRLNTNTALVGSVQEIGTLNADVSMAAVAFIITNNDTNESLQIAFTPPPTAAADTVIRVVATFRGTQIKY